MDDWTLLRAYAINGDQRAFTTLVERHIALVYHAAYRQLGDTSAAEEIAQCVFSKLAANASTLKPNGILAAWLYRVACRQAADFRRTETARRRREQQHAEAMIDHPDEGESELPWAEIAPLLDEAMQSLTEDQRSVVLMRVFEKRPLAEVGEALGIGEDAARKRVARALDQLRLWFERRGVRCTSHALGLTVGAFSASPIATNLVESTARAALEHAATLSISSTSTVITMASMKLPLVLGLVVGTVVPISLGYFTSPKPLTEVPHVARSVPTFELPDPETSDLMAEWKRLREEHGPNAGSMPTFYKVIAAIEDDFRRRSFRTALLAEWVEIDPTGALAFFEGEKDGSRIEDILTFWMKRDPQAAIAAMKQGGEAVRDQIGDLLDEVAELSPSDLADLAVHVKSKGHYDTRIRDAFASAAKRDLAAMKDAASAMHGESRKEALAGVAKAWAEKDGAAALEWVETLESSEDRSKAMRGMLLGWAKSDPATALDHLDLAPPGGGNPMFIGTETAELVLRAAGEANLDATLNWLAANSEKIKGDGALGLTGSLGKRFMDDVPGTLAMICEHPAARVLERTLGSIILNEGSGRKTEVWEWLIAQPRSELTGRLKKHVYMAASRQGPENVIAWTDEFLNDDSIPNNDSRSAAQMLINHGRDIHRIEELLEQAPQSLRQELLLAGFWNLSSGNIDQWIGRLDELPAEARPSAIGALASAQTRTDPEGAIAWAENFSDAERAAAYQRIVQTWAEADSYEASQWIADLPPSDERDYAVATLVNIVARAEPDSAWIWAQTIAHPEQRTQALHTALRQFGADATSVIEQSDLADPEKAALREWAAKQLQTTTQP